MVGIAVSEVRLYALGEVERNLVTNVIIATNLLMHDVDVGVKLLKLIDVGIENCGKVRTHGVVEADVDLAFNLGLIVIIVILIAGKQITA